MKLGVDVDGVQYDFVEDSRDWLAKAHELTGDGVAHRWNYFEDWGITLRTFLDECAKAVDAGVMFNSQPVNPEWVEVLTTLRAEGDTVHLLTDRSFGSQSMANTEKWLTTNKVPYDTLTFTRDKTVMDVDVLIDDKPQNIIDVYEACSAGWVVIYDQLWNAPDCAVEWERETVWATIEEDPTVRRVSSPREFLQLVRSLR